MPRRLHSTRNVFQKVSAGSSPIHKKERVV
jgi:hypothetical protein